MGQSFRTSRGLTPAQLQSFKLSLSAACRRMSTDQILDLAIIRARGARYGAASAAAFGRRESMACADRGMVI